MKEIWRERILDFDQDSQRKLLEMLKIPEPDGQKLVMVLAAAMALVLAMADLAGAPRTRAAVKG